MLECQELVNTYQFLTLKRYACHLNTYIVKLMVFLIGMFSAKPVYCHTISLTSNEAG